MTIFELAGYAAGCFTSLSCVPQVVQSWRTRSVRDLSRAMLLVVNIGLALWIVYGLHEHNWPIITANSVSLCLWSSLLWLKVRQGREPRT